MHKSIAFGLIPFLLSPQASTQASEQCEAFTTYSVAADQNAVREAFPLIEAAWFEFSDDPVEQDCLRASYSAALLDFGMHQEAAEVLAPRAISAEAESGALPFELLFQLGRAARVNGDIATSTTYFETASNIGAENMEQSFRAQVELARAWQDRGSQAEAFDRRARLVGQGYRYQPGSNEALVIARNLANQLELGAADVLLLDLLEGANAMALEDMDVAERLIESSVEEMAEQGAVDEYAIKLYVDWIGLNVRNWTSARVLRLLRRVERLDERRQEGRPIPLLRYMWAQSERSCIVLPESPYAHVTYSVNAEGGVPRTRVDETNMSDAWVEELRASLRTWHFLPARRGGEAVRVDGLRVNMSYPEMDC